MVTYSLLRVCGSRWATLFLHTVRWPYVFYANRTATSRFFSSPQGHHKPCIFIQLDIKLFQKPQCRNATTTPQGHCMAPVWWPCDGCEVTYVFYPVLGTWKIIRRPHCVLAAASRRPYGGRTANLWQLQQPWGCHAVASRCPCGHLTVFYSMNRTITVRSTQHLWPQLPKPARPYDF